MYASCIVIYPGQLSVNFQLMSAFDWEYIRFLGKVPRHIKVGYRYTGRYKKANGYRTKNKGKSMESLCGNINLTIITKIG